MSVFPLFHAVCTILPVTTFSILCDNFFFSEIVVLTIQWKAVCLWRKSCMSLEEKLYVSGGKAVCLWRESCMSLEGKLYVSGG